MANSTSTRKPDLLRLPRLLARGTVCGLILLILAGHGDRVHPMLDLASNFQMQYFVTAVICTVALWLLGSRRWSAVAGLCTVAPAIALAPWYMPRSLPEDVSRRPIVRVMQFNVLEPNTQYGAVIAEVLRHDVDVVVFQEVDRHWHGALEELSNTLPHAVFQPAAALRGNLVLSRHRLSNVLFEPSIGQENAPSLSATVHVGEQPVSLLVVHTVPPHDAHFSSVRNQELLRVAQRATELAKPVIVLGDLNTGVWSPHYKSLEREGGLMNARRGFGIISTFPMDGYAMFRVPLDHCLVSSDVAVVKFSRGRACGSDHAPIIAELALPIATN